MIKILIADDHPLLREGLKKTIDRERDMIVAGEASNGNEVLEKSWKDNYDVVLLDISMPRRSGLDILKELKKKNPNLGVLILTMHPEEEYAIRIMKSGASGYLTKDRATDELITAIRKVSRGGKYVSPSLAEKLAFDLEIDSGKPLHENLSNREYWVMCMLGKGKTTKEIAKELSLSETTIHSYRSRILEKMKMKKTSEIIYYAVKNGLVR